MNERKHRCTYVCPRVRTYAYVCMYVNMYVCICIVCIYVCMCVKRLYRNIYIYIYLYIEICKRVPFVPTKPGLHTHSKLYLYIYNN